MSEHILQAVYFSQPGPANTARVLDLVRIRAQTLSISHIVIATTSGATGTLAVQQIPDRKIIAVTHVTGFRGPNQQELLPEHRTAIEAGGGQILTCQHAFGGVNRAIRRKFNTYEIDEVIANILKLWGEGTKVAVEIALMAADAGLIPTDAPVIAVGGTGHGADTALLLQPANSFALFELRFLETICQPAPTHPAFRAQN